MIEVRIEEADGKQSVLASAIFFNRTFLSLNELFFDEVFFKFLSLLRLSFVIKSWSFHLKFLNIASPYSGFMKFKKQNQTKQAVLISWQHIQLKSLQLHRDSVVRLNCNSINSENVHLHDLHNHDINPQYTFHSKSNIHLYVSG